MPGSARPNSSSQWEGKLRQGIQTKMTLQSRDLSSSPQNAPQKNAVPHACPHLKTEQNVGPRAPRPQSRLQDRESKSLVLAQRWMRSRQQTPHFQKVCPRQEDPFFEDTAGRSSYAVTNTHLQNKSSPFKQGLGEAKTPITVSVFPAPGLNLCSSLL